MKLNNYNYDNKYVLHKDGIVENFLYQIKHKHIIFDDNHVLMVKQNNPNYPAYVYNPTGIANYALIRYNDLIENTNKLDSEVECRIAIYQQVEWLIKNRTDRKDMSLWYYNYPFKSHNCKPPWVSAMAQGLILSLLLRTYSFTKNEKYSELAERVANSMKTPISEGGFLDIDNDGDYWYQEYMGNCGYVLNGFIFSIWGVYDYYLYSKDEGYKTIFDKCVKTLDNNLIKYTKTWPVKWTVYDLKDKSPADSGYHQLHISLLKDLYAVTNDEIFITYADQWESYLTQPNLTRVSLFRKLHRVKQLSKRLPGKCQTIIKDKLNVSDD